MVSLVDVEIVLSISKLSMCVLNHYTAFLPGVYMLYICCIYVGYVILSFRLNLVSDNGLLDVFVILSIDS